MGLNQATPQQQLRGVSHHWTSVNPTLKAGEIGYETDTGKFKIGDGSTAWNSLTYFESGGTSPLTTKGDLYTYSTGNARLPVGTDGYVLKALSSETTGLVWAAESGGASSPSSSTGTTITFTDLNGELYNEASYLTSGNLTLDLTGAVKGAISVVYCKEYIPTISGETFKISGGTAYTSTVNIYSFFYTGTEIDLRIGNIEVLSAPSLLYDRSTTTEVTLTWNTITNADTYTVWRDVNSDFSTETQIYSGALLTYTNTSLVDDTDYYFRIKASGNGYETSAYDSVTAYSFTNSLLAAYQFEDNANDYTGTYNGTATAVTYATGDVQDKWGDFNTAGANVIIADAANWTFTGTDTFSFCVWFQADTFDTGANGGIWFINKRQNTSTATEWQFSLGNTKLLGLYLFDMSASANINATYDWSSGFALDTTYFICCTYDGSQTAAGITLSINGVRQTVSTGSSGTFVDMENTTSNITIGAQGWGTGNGDIDGFMDEIYVFRNRVLTEAEELELYNQLTLGTPVLP